MSDTTRLSLAVAAACGLSVAGTAVQYLDRDLAGFVLGLAAVYGLALSWYLLNVIRKILHDPDRL